MCNLARRCGCLRPDTKLNFQPMKRCYVTRRRETNPRQALIAHDPSRNKFGCCASNASPAGWDIGQEDGLDLVRLQRGPIAQQMSALGYIYRFLRLYQHSHQISVWSDWLKDALFHSAYVCKSKKAQIVFLSDTRLTGPAAASPAELPWHTQTRSSQEQNGGAHESCILN